MLQVIDYRTAPDGACLTLCANVTAELGPARVGSMFCKACPHNVAADMKKKIVVCSYEDSVALDNDKDLLKRVERLEASVFPLQEEK